jgi:hypothetical protein
MKNKTFHPKTGSFYQNWEIIRLEENEENISSFEKIRRKEKNLSRGIYLFFISLLGLLVYLSFVLPNISNLGNIFSGI